MLKSWQIWTTQGNSLPFWIRRKTKDCSNINPLMGLLIWPVTCTPSPLKRICTPSHPTRCYSPFLDCTEVRTERMSTKLDIHTSFIQANSIVVYFSRVCGQSRRPRRSVKHIVHCMKPHSVCLWKASRSKSTELCPKSVTFTRLYDHVHKVHYFVFIQCKYHVGAFQRNGEPVDFGPECVRLCACCDSSDAIRILQWLCCLSLLLRHLKADDPAMARQTALIQKSPCIWWLAAE